jgi:hypothetical protein
VRRDFLDEGTHLGLRQEVAGRVVRVGDPDHMGIGTNRGQHGHRIVAVVLRRRGDAFGAGRHRRQRIDGEGVARKHRGAPGRQEHAGGQIEHVVRAVAQHHLLLGHAMALGDRGDQVELVRIALDAGQGRLDRLGAFGLMPSGFSLEASLTIFSTGMPIWRASSVIGLPGM